MAKCLLIVFLFFGSEKIWGAELPGEASFEFPSFFTRAAFDQINDGYLEGATAPDQKWKNAAVVCSAITESTIKIVDEDKRHELASRLILFMQHRSVDLVPYYTEALSTDFSKLEENYYPFYCLSRRLKGHDELQDKFLRQLKKYGEITTGPDATFSLAKKLHREVNAKNYLGMAAAEFINRMVASDSPLDELFALPH